MAKDPRSEQALTPDPLGFVRDRDPVPTLVAAYGQDPLKGDRGWADLPPPRPLTGAAPFAKLKGGK